MIKKNCLICKKSIQAWPYEAKRKKYCSPSCRSKNQHNAWRGGLIYRRNYLAIRINGKYVLEHRYIMEKKIGRYLKLGEVVHHINHNPRDNRIENLMLMKSGEHSHLHHAGLYKPKSIKAMHKRNREAPRCGKPIRGWYKRPAGSPCQKPIDCPIH